MQSQPQLNVVHRRYGPFLIAQFGIGDAYSVFKPELASFTRGRRFGP